MRIDAVDVWTVVVPNKPGVVNSPEYPDAVLDTWSEVPKQIVRIKGGGYEGVGETPRGVPREQAEEGAKALIGQDPNRFPLAQIPIPRNGAYDAFEMAVFDLLGKAREVPAWSLLGGRRHDSVPVDCWLGLCTPEHAARLARGGLERGYHGIKTKGKVQMPIPAIVDAIKAVAPDWTVTIDPNERFHTPAQALAMARRLSHHTGIIFESPVPQRRLDWYARLRDTIGLPIAMHLGTVTDLIPALEQGCADIYNLNGTMCDFVIAAAAAGAAGCPVWHGSGNDLAIRGAAYFHACAAAATELWPSDIYGQELREDDLLVVPLPIIDGRIAVTEKPGLGIELDVAAVERYEVK
ncbi:MAG: hypothetical protein HYU66_19865 [Armatimonadetes bacterium]|nr:hypothetical protein [Armatimonadota bacterium]